MSYRGRPGGRYATRSPMAPTTIRRTARTALPVPTSVPELQAQLAEIVVHETGCRWMSGKKIPTRRDESLPAAEQRTCTCTAVAHRQHLFELITRSGPAAPQKDAMPQQPDQARP